MDNIIEALKKNERPFGLMSEEMQKLAKHFGFDKFDFLLGNTSGGWSHGEDDDMFRFYRTYRLREDYKEEPEAGVEKCEIYNHYGHLVFKNNGQPWRIHKAVFLPNFIGYLYRDGSLSASARLYVLDEVTLPDLHNLDVVEGRTKVLTPTHVLFSKKS